MKTETLINPHFYHGKTSQTPNTHLYHIADKKTINTVQVNARPEDAPQLFGRSGATAGDSKHKHYTEITKTLDMNYNKMRLRK